ncbi:hypothetical protein MASR1M12_07200 [Erysipelotrichia bacterium]
MKKIAHGLRDWFKDFVRALIFFLFLQTHAWIRHRRSLHVRNPYLREKSLLTKWYTVKEPEVGEVVVFSYPLEPGKDFVKRVVGIPGDVIEIKDGYLFRNGKMMKEPFVKEYVFGSYGPQKIPADKICVMGDNRNNSHDSRSWGLLDRNLVKGRAEIKFWPPDSFGQIAKLAE